jgi:hypothetical protein
VHRRYRRQQGGVDALGELDFCLLDHAAAIPITCRTCRIDHDDLLPMVIGNDRSSLTGFRLV